MNILLNQAIKSLQWIPWILHAMKGAVTSEISRKTGNKLWHGIPRMRKLYKNYFWDYKK